MSENSLEKGRTAKIITQAYKTMGSKANLLKKSYFHILFLVKNEENSHFSMKGEGKPNSQKGQMVLIVGPYDA